MDILDRLGALAKVRRLRSSAGWAVASALFALALAVRLAFRTQLEPAPFIPFFLAVLIGALVCGWRKALLLVAASTIASWFLLEARPISFPISPSFDVRLVAFLVGSLLAIALIEGLAQTVVQLEVVVRLNQDLFRELQHRVANNFQIVAATLEKARRGIADKAATDAIDQALARINALAHLHRRLYDPISYEKGFGLVLRETLAEIFHGLDVDLEVNVESAALSVNEMISLVLLVNEAAINAAKHVFRKERGRAFAVSLTGVKPRRVLTVWDDGPGFAATQSGTSGSRYGLAVMRGLATQLGGAFEMDEGPGAIIRVTF